MSAQLISLSLGIGPDEQNPRARYSKVGQLVEVTDESKIPEVDELMRKTSPQLLTVASTRKFLELLKEFYLKQNAASDFSDASEGSLDAFSQNPESQDNAAFSELPRADQLRLFLLKIPADDVLRILQQIQNPGKENFDSDFLEFKKQTQSMLKNFRVMHLLGTDELGRDNLVRLIFGARVSLGLALIVALFSSFVGLTLGGLAGYLGGAVDALLMRVTDSMLALPTIPVLIIFSAIDLNKIPGLAYLTSANNQNLFKLSLILCIFSWMTSARMVRSQILSLKQRDFILAAKSLGSSRFTIIFKHLLPNVTSALLVSVSLGVGQAVLNESILSFLGMGVQPPRPSWGNMLLNAQELLSAAPLQALLPGLLIFLTIVSFNFIGDGLQESLNPETSNKY